MNYTEAVDFLYTSRASFERDGATGYKPGLETTLELSRMFGSQHEKFRSIHVAGTNGKGSVCHVLASILAESGLKVGLYTSPHFVDFSERIRINGIPIPHEYIVRFVERYKASGSALKPSFFELTTILAFNYFAEQNVDVAVIETGLGGRLDSTNILTPILSIITGVSYDHTDLLGPTLRDIAREKAGIIKRHVPVVVGEAQGSVREEIASRAMDCDAPVVFAQDRPQVLGVSQKYGSLLLKTTEYGLLHTHWSGKYQEININTALCALRVLRQVGFKISKESVHRGVENVDRNTGFRGRWTILGERPKVICDSGHNVGALTQTIQQLKTYKYKTLRMVLGFMRDKDVSNMLKLLPGARAVYYFTNANSSRAMLSTDLKAKAQALGLRGNSYETVHEAYEAALAQAGENDVVFVGGSMYVLAELFAYLDGKK